MWQSAGDPTILNYCLPTPTALGTQFTWNASIIYKHLITTQLEKSSLLYVPQDSGSLNIISYNMTNIFPNSIVFNWLNFTASRLQRGIIKNRLFFGRTDKKYFSVKKIVISKVFSNPKATFISIPFKRSFGKSFHTLINPDKRINVFAVESCQCAITAKINFKINCNSPEFVCFTQLFLSI